MAQTDFTIAELLDEAGSLIERGWCQCRYGEDADGNMVPAESNSAVRWCATGAIERVAMRRSRATGEGYYRLWEVLTKALDAHLGEFRTCWNDRYDRTQAEVVSAFRNAAAKLRTPVISDTWTHPEAYVAADIESVEA